MQHAQKIAKWLLTWVQPQPTPTLTVPLPIAHPPTLPFTPEPTLIPGWQWVPSDWLYHWVVTYNPINNRLESLNRPCEDIKRWVAWLQWWETNPRAINIMRRIKQLHPSEINETVIGKFIIEETGIAPEQVPWEKWQAPTNALMLAMATVRPITISATNKFVGNGRHRIHAAAKCGLQALLIWVKE